MTIVMMVMLVVMSMAVVVVMMVVIMVVVVGGDEVDWCSLSTHLHLHGVSLNHLILDNVRFKLWWV